MRDGLEQRNITLKFNATWKEYTISEDGIRVFLERKFKSHCRSYVSEKNIHD